jgi:hypothetical protein
VRGKGIAQHVRRHPLGAGQPCGHGRLLDLQQSRLTCQGLAAVADRVEQPRGGRSAGMGSGQPLPLGNGRNRALMEVLMGSSNRGPFCK